VSRGIAPDSSSSDPRQEPCSLVTSNSSRRQQWLEKDQPSFIFDEITDPLVLTLCDTAIQAGPLTATMGKLNERERKQQFQPIANAIKKALETVLADVMRKFMMARQRDGIPKPEVQEAHHAFSEMVQMFNRAKVAAVDGQEAMMLAELRSIRPALEELITLRLKNLVQHFGAEKDEREALKSGLRALLGQCREWLHEDMEETVRPWSPSSAPASPGARQRAISSPVKPSEPWAQNESDRADRLSSSLSGHMSPRPSQHRIGTSSPSASLTPGSTSRSLLSPADSPVASPVISPVTSPVLNPTAVNSPKEGAKSFRLSALLGASLSPRSRDGGRKESPVKAQARQSLLNDSTSRASLPAQQGDMSAIPETAVTEKNDKSST
jgi:hypothetical protein